MSYHCIIAATIRHNVDLPSDVQLALSEFKHLSGCTDVRLLNRPKDLNETPFTKLPLRVRSRVEKTMRSGDPVGFIAVATPEAVHRVVTHASFLQDIAIEAQHLAIPSHAALFQRHGDKLVSAVPLRALCEYASYLFDTPASNAEAQLDALLGFVLRGDEGLNSALARAALASKKTTLALSHDLHIYKAKFFPRMVGALLNIYDGHGGAIIDPFSGSGTALLEAALVGQPSVGLDVDPLSALISACKVSPFTEQISLTRQQLGAVLADLDEDLPLLRRKSKKKSPSALPDELRGKILRRDTREGTNFLQEIEEDLCELTSIRDAHKGRTPGLIEVLLSDAVTKKIRYRFVGIGNGRYTIEVVTQRITERFRHKVASTLALCDVFDWLRVRCGVKFGESSAFQGNATTLKSLPAHIRVGACITSPPYLPASSGREHYASSRQLALELTGLISDWNESHFVGTTGEDDRAVFHPAALPPAAKELLEYLTSDREKADPQRDAMRFERKAVPTWRYLLDIEKFLATLRRRVTVGTPCLMVVASQHTFYSHRRLQEAKVAGSGADAIEYVAHCAPLYAELAERRGWKLSEEIRMELVKSATSMARPRSSDDYFESILVLRAS